MAILSKACKPDNFESHNSLKPTFTENIRGLHSNFVDCKSFLESNSLDILALCETNRDDSIDSGNFSLRLSSFNPKGFWYSCMVSQFTLKKDFPLHGILTYIFDWLYFTHCLTSISSIDHLLRFCARFFILFHLT